MRRVEMERGKYLGGADWFNFTIGSSHQFSLTIIILTLIINALKDNETIELDPL